MHERRWGRIGGHVVLDLVDTQSWRLDDARRAERIPDLASQLAWAAARQLITPATAAVIADQRDPEAEANAVAQVHAVRAAVTAVLDAEIAGEAPATADVLRLRQCWQEALAAAVVPAQLPLTWTIHPGSAAELAQLLSLRCGEFLRESHPGLRCCEGPGCGWLFLDTSRNGSRRWCDPRDCGNRVRVARHARAHRR